MDAFVDAGAPTDMRLADALMDAASASDATPMDAGTADSASVDATPGDAATTDAPVVCTYSCTVTIEGGSTTSDCAGPYVMPGTVVDGRFRATINMMTRTHLEISVTICDPTGFTIHVADSPGEDGFGGNGASSAAEVHLNGTTLAAYTNASSTAPGTQIFIQNNLLPPSGCRTGTVHIQDSSITLPERMIDWNSPLLLRLNAAGTAPDAPDALWYVGFNQTYQGRTDRVGTGVTDATICVH